MEGLRRLLARTRARLKANMRERDTEINRNNQVTIRYSFACDWPREWCAILNDQSGNRVEQNLAIRNPFRPLFRS